VHDPRVFTACPFSPLDNICPQFSSKWIFHLFLLFCQSEIPDLCCPPCLAIGFSPVVTLDTNSWAPRSLVSLSSLLTCRQKWSFFLSSLRILRGFLLFCMPNNLVLAFPPPFMSRWDRWTIFFVVCVDPDGEFRSSRLGRVVTSPSPACCAESRRLTAPSLAWGPFLYFCRRHAVTEASLRGRRFRVFA